VGALFGGHASATLPFFARDETPLAKLQIVLACIPWVRSGEISIKVEHQLIRSGP
jgi:hypothetical protein